MINKEIDKKAINNWSRQKYCLLVINMFIFRLFSSRGGVMQLTNVLGTVTVTYDYDAFGNLMQAYFDDTNPFRYCEGL